MLTHLDFNLATSVISSTLGECLLGNIKNSQLWTLINNRGVSSFLFFTTVSGSMKYKFVYYLQKMYWWFIVLKLRVFRLSHIHHSNGEIYSKNITTDF